MRDYGNDHVQALRERFSVFQGGKAGNELGCCIGKAWAAGLLEGHGADAQALRDAGRDYARLWYEYYGLSQVRTSRFERHSKGFASAAVTPDQRRFLKLDGIVSARPSAHRDAFYALCVDYFDSDALPPFVDRLINERLMLKGLKVPGCLPIKGDAERLEKAAVTLLAIVEGDRVRKAA
ncbi:MAG: hypothetical protein H0W74_12805 [Sphingosinicella sp.]|nr:hypothetical protein [Sphingosinicella sp.]